MSVCGMIYVWPADIHRSWPPYVHPTKIGWHAPSTNFRSFGPRSLFQVRESMCARRTICAKIVPFLWVPIWIIASNSNEIRGVYYETCLFGPKRPNHFEIIILIACLFVNCTQTLLFTFHTICSLIDVLVLFRRQFSHSHRSTIFGHGTQRSHKEFLAVSAAFVLRWSEEQNRITGDKYRKQIARSQQCFSYRSGNLFWAFSCLPCCTIASQPPRHRPTTADNRTASVLLLHTRNLY